MVVVVPTGMTYVVGVASESEEVEGGSDGMYW